MNDLNKLTDSKLILLARNLKKGLLTVIDMPEEKRNKAKDEKSCPPTASFFLNLIMLQSIETVARERGLDPTGPKWGQDLLGEIAAIQVEVLNGHN